ncbi:MAG TPA: flagellar basal body P-ring formation chaperone FlgA [Candidatus Solibacter sp.]|jgi:flagella basal body P-ring formation protein FlgA|nr:flagellar basal body P-ring formation chaperone FlgA [Candidatus Solibacter sp.]
MILLLMLAAAVPACHSLGHDRILGSDLAAASALFAGVPPDLVIANSPSPGAQRLFEPAELLRIVRANNLEVVEVTQLCFERFTAPLDPELVKAAMRGSLGAPLASIEILAMSKYPAPQGELVFPHDSLMQPVSGNLAVWSGYVAYDGGRFPIWARIHLTALQSRLVCVVDLIPGHLLQASDLRIEEANEFPRRLAPLTTIEAAVGQSARRAIPAGSVLIASMLEAPNEVERGQTVLVEVQSGGAVLKMEAKAESAGRRGDTVSVRNADSGKVFRAKIEGKGRVVVKCRSASEVTQ